MAQAAGATTVVGGFGFEGRGGRYVATTELVCGGILTLLAIAAFSQAGH